MNCLHVLALGCQQLCGTCHTQPVDVIGFSYVQRLFVAGYMLALCMSVRALGCGQVPMRARRGEAADARSLCESRRVLPCMHIYL